VAAVRRNVAELHLSRVNLAWAVPASAALAAATFVHLGKDADAALWAIAQIVLVALAAIDVETRRLPNVITLPTASVALLLRAIHERADLAEVAAAGAAAFAVSYLLALLLGGGLGMGDVKLAGMLGCLLGSEVLPALALGIIAGGLWSAGLLITRRAGLRSTLAYGPFLCLGGAVAIVFASPPPLA
jgi:leader peptidase (prepilin peptidase)/N-methyltransferase